jgi:shikimate 5-dehydrogenase
VHAIFTTLNKKLNKRNWVWYSKEMKEHDLENKMFDKSFPYTHEIIPIVRGLDGYQTFVEQFKDFNFCPYLADKTDKEWAVSTSRQYMNRVLPHFLYVPVNIDAGDTDEVRRFVTYADNTSSIAAVNITKPHKSTEALREYFFNDPHSSRNVDTLIKGEDGKLQPFDLNAPAFTNWFKKNVTDFKAKEVIILGVGGVGEPVAKHIDKEEPSKIYLVDISDRKVLSQTLKSQATYVQTLDEIPRANQNTIFINASGKDGLSDDTGIYSFLANSPGRGIFVDLRPQLKIEIVEAAKECGWDAYTGNGMNARNDYELLLGITNYLKISAGEIPTFQDFSEKVSEAS